mgnify:CR=1 FL=1
MINWNDPKHLLAAVAVVVVVIVGLYYLMSPYQNCVRESSYTKDWCITKTGW